MRGGTDQDWHGRIPLFSIDWRHCFTYTIIRGWVAGRSLCVFRYSRLYTMDFYTMDS